MQNDYVVWFKDISLGDLPLVGGKIASLGEMIKYLSRDLQLPDGFAVTTKAYHEFIKINTLNEEIDKLLTELNVDNIADLQKKGKKIREMILSSPIPLKIEQAITEAYQELVNRLGEDLSVSVRSSATAEDLPEASFAGQQETYLNVVGIEEILEAVRKVFASLFNDRAIAYRALHSISNGNVGISVGVQQMIRSDLGSSGVIFTLDTESGFDKVVFISAGYGLGELLVQGKVNPDEYYVFKPSLKSQKKSVIRKVLGSKQRRMIFKKYPEKGVQTEMVPLEEQNKFVLTEHELETLARLACAIEEHYGRPMDIEWAKDGLTNELYILQARPETVEYSKKGNSIESYRLKQRGKEIIRGRSVGRRIGQGTARVILSVADIDKVNEGEVLITDMTDPDWEPVMKGLSAIVTNRGGRTCHAAIVARENGIPAVVGCGSATNEIKDGQTITVSCAEGDIGIVYEGLLEFDHQETCIDNFQKLPIKIMMTFANPAFAFRLQSFPSDGVGLARMEFIISDTIGIHPKACLEFEGLPSVTKSAIEKMIAGYDSPRAFYVAKLKEGIATIAAAFWPRSVVIRFSDFKSNEYANLLGGDLFEPKEENPMLGFRGASRYISPLFKDCFAMECEAMKEVREDFGLNNVEILIPFVRTVNEAKLVVDAIAQYGLKRSENGLRLIMMCEIPSNILSAREFLNYFDGYSIGSNDLTQLTLGIDRDSELVAGQFDERNPAVLELLDSVISICKEMKKSISICGQGPSDHPDFALWLVEKGIDCLSLNPDTVLETWLSIAKQQRKDTERKDPS